jgi:aspartate-semialdehyde dehydrogenase
VTFDTQPTVDEVIDVLENFRVPEVEGLPSAPPVPVLVTRDPARPQTRLDRDAHGGMAVTVGRIGPSATAHIQFVALGHNTFLGAAGGALLNAELLLKQRVPAAV